MCAFNKVLAHIVAMCDTNMPFIGLRIEVGIKTYFVSFFPSPAPDSDVWMWLLANLQSCAHSGVALPAEPGWLNLLHCVALILSELLLLIPSIAKSLKSWGKRENEVERCTCGKSWETTLYQICTDHFLAFRGSRMWNICHPQGKKNPWKCYKFFAWLFAWNNIFLVHS